MEIQKTLTSQSNLEEEEWNWRNQPAWLQTPLQSYSHQDSMVLAQRQKYRSMEQNRKPRDNPCSYGHLIFDKGGKNIQWWKDNHFNKLWWETGQPLVKEWNWTGTLSNTIHKNKMDWRSKCKTRNYETPRGKHGQNTLWHKSQQDPLWPTSQNIGNKSKNNKWDLINLKSFGTSKETISKVKRQPSEWEKIIANEATDKELISICFLINTRN